VARSVLVVVRHLLSDPTARSIDLGADFYDQRINKDGRTRDLSASSTQLSVTGSPSPQPPPECRGSVPSGLCPAPRSPTLKRVLLPAGDFPISIS